jgi:hypothetical protein
VGVFEPGTSVKLYLMSIAISPGARSTQPGLHNPPLDRLLGGFLDKLAYYATHHRISVSEFVAVGWTDEGKRLCQILRMENVGQDRYGHPVFKGSLRTRSAKQAPPFPGGLAPLLEIYRDEGLL